MTAKRFTYVPSIIDHDKVAVWSGPYLIGYVCGSLHGSTRDRAAEELHTAHKAKPKSERKAPAKAATRIHQSEKQAAARREIAAKAWAIRRAKTGAK
jgi:hypothetical protein